MKEINMTITINDVDTCSHECQWLGNRPYCGFSIPHCNLFSTDMIKGLNEDVMRTLMCVDIKERLRD